MSEGAITLISFVATLMVFSYLLGDLPLVSSIYRTAVYIFIGMSAAFTLIATYEGIILPYLTDIQDTTTSWTALGNQADVTIFVTALLFGLLLLLKPIASLSWLTNSILAVLIVGRRGDGGCGRTYGYAVPAAARGDGCAGRHHCRFQCVGQHRADLPGHDERVILFSVSNASGR